MKVIALTIWNPDAAATITLHTTQAGAREALTEWVQTMWTAGAVGCDINGFPTTGDMVAHFFEAMAEDYQYDLSYKHVHGSPAPGQPELGPDEVFFYPKEIQATIYALENTRFAEMAHAIGSGPGTCHQLAKKIIEKLKD